MAVLRAPTEPAPGWARSCTGRWNFLALKTPFVSSGERPLV